MEDILAVFRSRTQTNIFAEYMRAYGLRCSVIQTPPEAKVGCGVSAKFRAADLRRAEQIIRGRQLSSFSGFYEIMRITGRTIVRKIR